MVRRLVGVRRLGGRLEGSPWGGCAGGKSLGGCAGGKSLGRLCWREVPGAARRLAGGWQGASSGGRLARIEPDSQILPTRP
jgi:hypothetical protein